MARDKGYGSGKSRSAANSADRRAAAGKATSRKKTIQGQAAKPGVRLGVSRVGKTENAGFNIGGRKYLETGVSANKLSSVAKALFESGRFSAAEVVGSRLHAKRMGAFRSRNLSGRSGKTPVENLSPRLLDTAKRGRAQSESMFPRVSGAQSKEFLGMNSREITANLARRVGPASGLKIKDIREASKATANSTTKFTKFSKNLTKRGR